MAVRQRYVWLTDLEWETFGRIAKSAGMTRSRLLVQFMQPPNAKSMTQTIPADQVIPDLGVQWREQAPDVPRTITPYVPRPTHDPTFRPAPKPGKR